MSLTSEYIRHKKTERELYSIIQRLSQFIEDTIEELTKDNIIKRQEMYEKFIKYMIQPNNSLLEECDG